MSGGSGILAVVDTNLVVSSVISNRGAPYQLIHALYAGKFQIVLTDALLEEYVDVLSRPFLLRYGDIAKNDIAAFIRFLGRHGVTVSPSDKDHLPVVVRDLDDVDLLTAAFGGHAGFLVTGDNDLLVLADDPGVGRLRIVNPREFLNFIEQE